MTSLSHALAKMSNAPEPDARQPFRSFDLPSELRLKKSVKGEGPLVQRLLQVMRNAGARLLDVGVKEEDDEDLYFSICRARRRLNYSRELD